jgi:hypothetical protein
VTALAGPMASWLLTKLGPIGKWVKRRVTPDHLPITGFPQGRQTDGIPPSSSSRPYHPVTRPGLYQQWTSWTEPVNWSRRHFRGTSHASRTTAGPGYGGDRLVRYRRVVDGVSFAERLISIHSTGLVTLQWIVAAPPSTALPLADGVAAVRRLHRAVQGSTS